MFSFLDHFNPAFEYFGRTFLIFHIRVKAPCQFFVGFDPYVQYASHLHPIFEYLKRYHFNVLSKLSPAPLLCRILIAQFSWLATVPQKLKSFKEVCKCYFLTCKLHLVCYVALDPYFQSAVSLLSHIQDPIR